MSKSRRRSTSAGMEPKQAQTGKHLAQLITEGKESVITTVIDKFDAAVDGGRVQE